MDINLNNAAYLKYTSGSQKARVLTEPWVKNNLYCPRCGNPSLESFPNNKKVADFFCPACSSQFELKSKNGKFSKKVLAGEYNAMIQRITSNENPDFLFMSYSNTEKQVNELFFVPKHFFTPYIIEKRKPLSNKAKRAGWTGCNILINEIPEQGKVEIISERKERLKTIVLNEIAKISTLSENNIEKRSWLMDVLSCVNQIPTSEFTSKDIYAFESTLSEKHPNNKHIKDKIRQQLQLLRDKGIVEFANRGIYRKIV